MTRKLVAALRSVVAIVVGLMALSMAVEALELLLVTLVNAVIAGRAPMLHAAALASLQTVAFAWAFFQPEMRAWTPDWMWLALTVVSGLGIVWGGRLRLQRSLATAATLP